MTLTLQPGTPLHGAAHLPGDKSISHRAALLGAMAVGRSQIENFLSAAVTKVLLNALSDLGIHWELQENTLLIEGNIDNFRQPAAHLDCGNSATTMRLLAGGLAASGVSAVLDGSPGLRRRPMRRIIDPLQAMGVPITAGEGGTAPLVLAGRPSHHTLQAIEYTLPVASAQVKSTLLLAALAAKGKTILHEPSLSRDHTERMLNSMGVPVTSSTNVFGVNTVILDNTNLPTLKPLCLMIPGDISSAAFLILAALITPGSEITIQDVGLNETRTGLLDALTAMGADIQVSRLETRSDEPCGDLTIRHSQLHGIEVKGSLVVRMIDEFPVFAVAAAFAKGKTTVKDAAELRSKESDRISALCQEMHTLGVNIEEFEDGFIVHGTGQVGGGVVNPHGDHRLAMSLAIAGLASQSPITVQDAHLINESYPEFIGTLKALGVILCP